MKFTNPFKKPTEAEKVLSEIESIEFKKGSIISAMVSAENEFERQKTSCFAQLGEYVYRCHLEDKKDYQLEEFFQTIEDMEKILSDKKEKVSALSERYDEEISLLSVNLSVSTAIVVEGQSVSSKYCRSCGNTLANGDMFCQSCGKKQ